jgi:hypothetical protein
MPLNLSAKAVLSLAAAVSLLSSQAAFALQPLPAK